MKRKLLSLSLRYQAMAKTLSLNAKDLTTMNRILAREVLRRERAELALETSKRHHNQLLRESRIMQEQLRHLSRQILLAQEDERKKISRELHDEIAQILAGINVHLASLTMEATVNTKGLKNKITRTQRLVEKSVNIVHQFARELRPTVLDDLGLIPALQSFITEFTKNTGILIRFKAFIGVEELNNAKRTVLYRIAQETLSNVSQHAHATQVKFDIRKFQNTIQMEINDNGRSFQTDKVLHSKKCNRLGILGMRERVEMVGGNFNVDSAPTKGTTILVQIPLYSGSSKRKSPQHI